MKPTTTGTTRRHAVDPDLRRVGEPERHVTRSAEPARNISEDPGEQRRRRRPSGTGASRGRSSRLWKRAVAGQPALEQRPQATRNAEHDEREEHAAPERVRDERVVADRDVEARHQAQRADQPAEVPVGLRAVRRDVGVERPPEPDRVDLDEPAEQHEHAGDARTAARASAAPGRGTPARRRAAARSSRGVPGTACGAASATSARCAREQHRDQRREEEDVGDVHAREEAPAARGTAPPQISAPRFAPTNGIESATRVADREPHAGEQVVDERVAEVALEQRERSASSGRASR